MGKTGRCPYSMNNHEGKRTDATLEWVSVSSCGLIPGGPPSIQGQRRKRGMQWSHVNKCTAKGTTACLPWPYFCSC